MTASLLLTLSAMLAGLVAGELVCWLLFDDDSGDEEETNESIK